MNAAHFTTHRVEWTVDLTEPKHKNLEPVGVFVRAGPASFHEYVTPEEARRLAALLMAKAVEAEGQRCRECGDALTVPCTDYCEACSGIGDDHCGVGAFHRVQVDTEAEDAEASR